MNKVLDKTPLTQHENNYPRPITSSMIVFAAETVLLCALWYIGDMVHVFLWVKLCFLSMNTHRSIAFFISRFYICI